MPPVARVGTLSRPLSLVEMQSGHIGIPPFFLLHPVGGSVLCYRGLAQQLGVAQPVYGIQARGLDGEDEPCVNLEEMAAHYLRLVQTVQPQGPYQLGGWSLGGLVAFEMTHQLHDQGQDVALLALIDSITPRYFDEPDEAAVAAYFARDLGGVAGHVFSVMGAELRPLSPEEQLQYIVRRARQLNIVPPDMGIEHIRPRLQVFKANIQAIDGYRPQAYSGRITLFCTQSSMQTCQDPSLGWDAVATGGLMTHTIPGDHYSIVRSHVLAEQLRTCLDASFA